MASSVSNRPVFFQLPLLPAIQQLKGIRRIHYFPNVG